MKWWFVPLLVGCSGAAPTKAVAVPGQVAVLGDATFRTRADGGVDVTVVRTFENGTGTGVATLRTMDLPTAEHCKRCVNHTWLRQLRAPRLWRCESPPSEAS